MVSQGVPAKKLGTEAKEWVAGRKFGGEGLCDPLERGAVGEGRLQQVLCCRARDETGGLDKWKER